MKSSTGWIVEDFILRGIRPSFKRLMANLVDEMHRTSIFDWHNIAGRYCDERGEGSNFYNSAVSDALGRDHDRAVGISFSSSDNGNMDYYRISEKETQIGQRTGHLSIPRKLGSTYS